MNLNVSAMQTLIIVIITVIISLIAFQNKGLQDKLIFYPPAVNAGGWHRFITHGFIHADGMHLFFNMFVLYSFGQVVEKLFGIWFTPMYLIAIVVAMIPSYLSHKNDPRYRSLGASGGVSAVLFAYILVFPWNMLYFFGIVPIPAIIFAILYVAYSVYANKKGNSNINHSAHLWGGAFGVLAVLALNPAALPHFFTQLMNPSF